MNFSPWPVAVLLLALSAAACQKNAEEPAPSTFITIGTGGVTGVYYPVGGALAKLINEHGQGLELRASAEATGGSVFNVNAVLNGDIDFGIAQADRQYQAYNGLAEWADTGPRSDLRAVCTLYTEMVTLVAAEDAGIASVSDLKGKRVNIGNPGSGTRINALDALRAAGIDPETDIEAQGITSAESSKMLQDDRIDAYFFTAGHPAGAFMEATAGRRTVRFLPLTGVESLAEEAPYYSRAFIPIALYPSAKNDADVETLGVKTTLITSGATPEGLVYTVTKVLFENLDAFRAQHPSLERLVAEEMVQGNFVPLHPGAEKYYKEAGLL